LQQGNWKFEGSPGKQRKSSFLKKRSKKLLLGRRGAPFEAGRARCEQTFFDSFS
jgi:hypothetical protein